MAKTDNRPAEFPSDWHYEQHLEDTGRELAGRLNRVAELQAMNAHPDQIAQAEAEVAAARDELEKYGAGQKTASKRPAARGRQRG